jgi:tetratricopeptide (TPR) repeat protein
MAMRLLPTLPEPHNNQGNIYKDRNEPLEALGCYNKAISLGSQNPLVFVNAATVALQLLRYDEAERFATESLRRAPGLPAALNCQALALQGLRRFKEAITVYQQLLGREPNNIEYLNNLGILWKDLGELQLAKDQFDAILKAQPDHIGSRINLALVYDLGGHKEEAESQYRAIIEQDANNTTALLNLGELLCEKGEQRAAIETLLQALDRNPNSAIGRASLAKALSRQGSYQKAKEQIDKALELAPGLGFIWSAKGSVESELRNVQGAIDAWEKSLSLQPKMLETYLSYAGMFSTSGDTTGYREIFQRGRDALGDKPALLLQWAFAEEKNNQLAEAGALLAMVETMGVKGPFMFRLKATLARRAKQYEQAFAYISQVSPEQYYVKEEAAAFFFELGHIQDKRGNYNEAFAAFKAGNELKNEFRNRHYSDEDDQEKQQRIREFFCEHFPALREQFSQLGESTIQPVFIVGFPRSGTSLLEQILGVHTQISAAGELRLITDLVRSGEAQRIIGSQLNYPECLLDKEHPLVREKIEAMRNYYLDSVTAMGVIAEGSRWVTDKMPHNALHVGLISLLFPNSPIIHISRHPLNPVLSAYFSNFNAGHNYCENLESTAKHYRNFMETLNYYKANLPMKFIEIHYEDLVDDQERVVRELLEFIDVPWDANCLQHHKSQRLVRTASYEQVTQQVYRGSLERYKNYWEAVQPIIPILESTIKDFGYTVDTPEA